jgi:hypothetical protein
MQLVVLCHFKHGVHVLIYKITEAVHASTSAQVKHGSSCHSNA